MEIGGQKKIKSKNNWANKEGVIGSSMAIEHG